MLCCWQKLARRNCDRQPSLDITQLFLSVIHISIFNWSSILLCFHVEKFWKHCNCPKLCSPSSSMWSIIWLWVEEEEDGEIFILCRPVTPYLSPSLFVIELSPLWTIIRLYFSSQGLLTSNLLTFDTSETCFFLIDLSSVLSCAHKCKCALSGNL